MWFRLRRGLAGASAAFVISPDEARKLIAEGHQAGPVGHELEQPKLIICARAGHVEQITSARPVPVPLSRELLEAECLTLTPFDPTA